MTRKLSTTAFAASLLFFLTAPAAYAQSGDIVEVAAAAGSFETLLVAATEAGLVDVLKSDGPFTVFAPTDEAFSKVPEADLTALLADKDALASVLLYHVVPGKVMASQVAGLKEAETANGQKVAIEVVGESVKVDEATVIATDIDASNGVIHVIDRVILPEM